ncbi:coiled-coil domain-containing protein 186 isoform X3 [Anoplolepis gracilipes]|uniref:coiled-coil domain-containing protein 186 isoform X3 n=1 Tax=Anoplolepis gracilipes TaxID=354296 RepID=UPI003B9F4221
MSEQSEFLDDETNFPEKCDGANFIPKQDVRLIEGSTMQNGVLQIQNKRYKSNMFRSKSDSTLSRKSDGRLKSDCQMIGNINLLTRCDVDKSSINISNTKLPTYHLSNSESCLSYDNECLWESFSNNTSVSLSIIPVSYLDSFLVKNKVHKSENVLCTYENIIGICTDKEETLFNRLSKTKSLSSALQCSVNEEVINVCENNLIKDKHDKNHFKEQTAAVETNIFQMEQSCTEILDLQSQINNNVTLNEKNQDEKEDLCKENETNSTLTLNAHMQNSLTTRPTLADDSKLVKMSLLTNPITIMQSNVQLLNKSRNFFNFITEKSTNIMEKALLPQHLAMKYNHISKSIDTNGIMGFYANNESSLKDIIGKTRLDTDLTMNPSNNHMTNCTVKPNYDKNKDKLDSTTDSEVEVNPSTCIKENKLCDNLKNAELHNNFKNEISEEKEYIFQKNDVDRLDCDITNEQPQDDVSEINKNKSNFLHKEKLHNDMHEEDSSSLSTLVESNILSLGSSEHPLYLTLLEDYTSLKLKNAKLLERIEHLEKSNRLNKSFCETQTNTDTFILQTENLEKTINKLTADLNASLDMQEALKKECMAVNKEKEDMVMKYVISEKHLIDSQRARDSTERKVKELLKDQELLQNKLRQTQGERTRICNIMDGKCREIADLQKEIERLKEDAKMKEIKQKWTQNKLKTEIDLQKETQQKLDKALMKINDMKEECEQIRRETQESFRKFQQSEENKAVTLDQQLKEHQARLILERHVTEDKETLRLQLQKELETLKSRQQNLIEENNRLSLKVQESEKARLNNENNLSDLKIVANQRQEQITELLNKVSQLEASKLQLQHKEECIVSAEAQILQLRSANEELRFDMQACRQKEADMLDFTQKLTDKNVRLQSEFIAIQTKASDLESEHGPLHDCINELTNKIKVLEEDLVQERKKRKEECEILAKHVAEQTQRAQNFAQKWEDSQGENAVLKRKHQISIKEMTRELQQCRRKLEMFEAASPSNSLDITSRTGSNTSLTGDALNGALSDNNANNDHIYSVEPNKQVLMDRIIKLQETNVKRAVKIDFFEEHTQTLMEELQKKTKIIQNYILCQDFGALACNERDKYKAELARHGGIMASVYNHRVSDENMTLELSLEINQKLQTVLEDALLKNITLKDNIDTLGKEIAKLTMQHQQK